MPSSIVRAPTQPSELSTDLREDVRVAEELRTHHRAENTLRAYRQDWAVFSGWCEIQGLVAMPAAPQTLAAYVGALVRGSVPGREGVRHPRKPSTIRRHLSSISKAHAVKGIEPSPTKHALVREAVEGAMRVLGVRRTKKRAATSDVVIAMLRHVAGTRDRCILLLGFYMGARRSEIVGVNIEDVSFGEQGVTVLIQRSKTDQHGEGMHKFIPRTEAGCIESLRSLIASMHSDGITSGALFRSSKGKRERLADHHVATLIKRAIDGARKETGDERFDEKLFSGHSLRAGLVTTLSRNGVPIQQIQPKTGHKTLNALMEYVRHENDWERDPARGLM